MIRPETDYIPMTPYGETLIICPQFHTCLNYSRHDSQCNEKKGEDCHNYQTYNAWLIVFKSRPWLPHKCSQCGRAFGTEPVRAVVDGVAHSFCSDDCRIERSSK